MIAMLSSVTIGGRSKAGAGEAKGGARTAGIVEETALGVMGAAVSGALATEAADANGTVGGGAAETAGGAGVADVAEPGIASSGIFNVRRERLREPSPGALGSRAPSGPSKSGIAGGPSERPVPEAWLARGRGGAAGVERGGFERLTGAGAPASERPIAESSAASDGGASAFVDSVGTSSGIAPP